MIVWWCFFFEGNFTKEAQLMRDRFEQRTNNAIESIKKAMGEASRELWNCDPKKHVRGMCFTKKIIFFY